MKFRVYDTQLETIKPVSYIDFEAQEVMYWADDNLDIVRSFDEAIIMEGTGMPDKTGTEIFDGDIVKFKKFTRDKYHYGEVARLWSGEFYLLYDGFTEELWLWNKGVEVVGNVHENEEMLGEV